MRIGFFGGSFNPPHFGHLLAASYALSRFNFDQMWWVPVYQHAFAKRLSPFEDRCAMLNLMLQDLGPKHRLSLIEKEIASEGKTLLVLEELKRRHPESTLCIVVGSDAIENFRKWYQYDTLKKNFEMCIVPRKTYLTDDDEFFIPNVSSTAVRKTLRDKSNETETISSQNLARWLHPKVTQYIRQNKLFGA